MHVESIIVSHTPGVNTKKNAQVPIAMIKDHFTKAHASSVLIPSSDFRQSFNLTREEKPYQNP